MHNIFHLERTILIGDTSDVEGCIKYELYRDDDVGFTHAISYRELAIKGDDGKEYMHWAKIESTVLSNGRDVCRAIDSCIENFKQHYKK